VIAVDDRAFELQKKIAEEEKVKSMKIRK